MSSANPAIVTQSAVRRLPRLALMLLGLAYVLPGFVGREPWKNIDVATFGAMMEMVRGSSGWWAPQVLGAPVDVAGPLPYWLGALSIRLLPFLSPDLAGRIPFGLLLALTLVCTWYAVYHLARQLSAQPVAFAFGGEADPIDYARALADGALLALVACLGLAQMSHETSPDVARLSMVSAVLMAASRMALPATRRPWLALLLWCGGTIGLVFSGAPWVAFSLGLGLAAGVWYTRARQGADNSREISWVIGMLALVLVLAAVTEQIHWPASLSAPEEFDDWRRWGQLLVWFTWPAWPLALWTLWRWRHQLLSPHVALPLWTALVSVVNSAINPDFDRSLLLALPAMAALASFALPTLRRSVAALIDWFTLVFFSGCALVIWVIWLAMQTGFPAKPAANVARLAPGFVSEFSWLLFLPALLATIAWGWLVSWRVGRHRQAIWKSLVLPAAGATLCWLLLMTLWLPLLDFGRSYGPLARRISRLQPENSPCVLVDGLGQAQIAALQFQGHMSPVRAGNGAGENCRLLVVHPDSQPSLDRRVKLVDWAYKGTVRRLSDKEPLLIYLRIRGG